MIRLIISLEIMMIGSALNFVTFARYFDVESVHVLGHVVAILSISIGGCIMAIGLGIVLFAYKHYKTLDIRELRRLRR
jgi:NADH-quinone oxidoreductase subunit K